MCGDFDDEFDEEFNDACESGLMLSIGEDGQLEIDETEIGMDNVDEEEFIERILALNEDGDDE